MKLILTLFLACNLCAVFSQQTNARLELGSGQSVKGAVVGERSLMVKKKPLISYQLDKGQFTSFSPSNRLSVTVKEEMAKIGYYLLVTFSNISTDTVTLHNVLPFAIENSIAYITGLGSHPLSRTHLFLPHKTPVNVIVPDNAWELGYNAIKLADSLHLTALVRRDRESLKNGRLKRFETDLYPQGSINYRLYADASPGQWQQGLTQVFQQRMLYDVEGFDNSLFDRKDLQWIRHTYVMHLMDAWDRFYYDYTDNRYHLQEFLQRGKRLYGGDDVVSIWPTWPTLGLDQRNQFDLYRDLPGGIAAMKKQAVLSRRSGTKFFVCYNPWDESTRKEDHFKGLSNLIAETSADGVILDTKGGSSGELQHAADRVSRGVIMYSEGMAIPKDMAGIVSGRVHNALYYAPMLNLNKLIKPEFTIYRVAELYKEKIRREFNTSFFNGYGTEINIMAPGQPDWVEQQYEYLGFTSRILRENTHNFTNRGYTPLIPASAENIWVNQWIYGNKTLYTIYSLRPSGYKGKLFSVEPEDGFHFVDLWHHRLLYPEKLAGKWMIEATTEPFAESDLGTNNEGAVDCIARLPILVRARLYGDELILSSGIPQTDLQVWAGKPAYGKKPLMLKAGNHRIRVSSHFGRFEGDLIIQLVQDGILLDETIVTVKAGEPRRISVQTETSRTAIAPEGMIRIPPGSFRFKATHGDEFIRYPTQDLDSIFSISAYFIDQFPVTNARFKRFLQSARYRPTDTANFLKHWLKGNIPPGQENYPVVYISYEDAKAYAAWAGKRLPTEIEWQYAAQTREGREWPWDQQSPVTRKNQYVNSTLTVTQLDGIDSAMCNLGNGELYPVGSYPAGKNPFGLQDLVGCVWQLTNDLYMTGSHRYIILKGGSYFKPSSSWWYVQGGPRELHYRQFLLRVNQGFERNATVGFRCAKDASQATSSGQTFTDVK